MQDSLQLLSSLFVCLLKINIYRPPVTTAPRATCRKSQMWNLYTFEELTDTFVTEPKLQLNPVDADTEGTIESVRIKRLSVKRGLTVTP